MNMGKTVVIDTNSFVYAFDKKLDLLGVVENGLNEKCEFMTLSMCINELKRIKRNDVARWVGHLKVTVIETNPEGFVDDQILSVASRREAYLLTQDKILRDRAKQEGLKTVNVVGQNAFLDA